MNDQIIPLIALGVSVLLPLIGWLVSDSKAKAREGFLEERVTALKQDVESGNAALVVRTSALEVALARSQQDREEIHRAIERIDDQKASRETVDGFRADLTAIKADMDKRFDKLERMIEALVSNNK